MLGICKGLRHGPNFVARRIRIAQSEKFDNLRKASQSIEVATCRKSWELATFF
jgi:hypothetical protein